VVTVNHRLDAFGYLYLGQLDETYADSGLAGLLDIVAALRWVRENIAAFGGDPECVTIFGESGGGDKVNHLLAMPDAQGLFQRAVIQAGSQLLHAVTREESVEAADRLLAELGVDSAAALCEVSAQRLMSAAAAVAVQLQPRFAKRVGFFHYVFAPAVDARRLPAQPLAVHASGDVSSRVPLMIGQARFEHFTPIAAGVREEFGWLQDHDVVHRLARPLGEPVAAALVAGYRRSRPTASASTLFAQIATDAGFRVPAVRVAEARLRCQAPVYVYETRTEPIFDTLTIADNAHLPGYAESVARALASQINPAWVAFARDGDPGHPALPPWPPYTLDERATMIFDYECAVQDDPHRSERQLWDAIAL
jgi:para-nitrobenzyl esterase